MSRFAKAAPLALLILAGVEARAEPLVCADIALVLAIDGSGSVTNEEFQFQKSAIADAFRDETIRSVLTEAGTVFLSAVFWGDGEFPTQNLDWFVVRQGVGTDSFADTVESAERQVYGDTDIGSGLWSALDMLSDPHLCARRLIINLSGDGRETTIPKRRQRASLPQARKRAIDMGVTINALAITNDDEALASYYARDVVRGTGGFTMEVANGADYAAAIRSKLQRELSPRYVAGLFHKTSPLTETTRR